MFFLKTVNKSSVYFFGWLTGTEGGDSGNGVRVHNRGLGGFLREIFTGRQINIGHPRSVAIRAQDTLRATLNTHVAESRKRANKNYNRSTLTKAFNRSLVLIVLKTFHRKWGVFYTRKPHTCPMYTRGFDHRTPLQNIFWLYTKIRNDIPLKSLLIWSEENDGRAGSGDPT